MSRRTFRTALGAALLAIVGAGCGQTFVFDLPSAPRRPFGGDELGPAPPALPRVECRFMTLLIDYSRKGEIEVAARVASAMAKEFETFGTRVTDEPDEAYWSLMILASDNARRDGFVFSALLSARNTNEGYDPGVNVYAGDGAPEPPPARSGSEFSEGTRDDVADLEAEDPELRRRIEKLPTLYNGLAYGPYDQLEDQSRAFARQAYAAIFPAAKRLCDYQASEERREESLEGQLPGPPEPL